MEHLLPWGSYELGLFVVGDLVGYLVFVGAAVSGEAVGLAVVGSRTIHMPLQLPSHWDWSSWHQLLLGCSHWPEPHEQHPSPKFAEGFGAGVLDGGGFVWVVGDSVGWGDTVGVAGSIFNSAQLKNCSGIVSDLSPSSLNGDEHVPES